LFRDPKISFRGPIWVATHSLRSSATDDTDIPGQSPGGNDAEALQSNNIVS